jgi:phenylacetate-CoA ligase
MFCDEEVILEIVKPGSDKILEDGEVGEIVVTTLNEDYPLFRFATGDLSAVITEKSRCGRTATRIKGWMGRADQTTKVRGMFVRPEQIANIENELGFKSKLRLLVDSKKHEDVIKMLVETDSKEVTIENVKDTIRAELKLRAEVELVSMGTIPNDGIVIEDKRTFE